MRETLLTINAVYFLFGATIYCGVMWSLRYFFYPSWSKMNVGNVQDHFIIPTTAATKFFLVVVPLMMFSALVMVITEWGEGQAFVAALVCLAGIIVSTYVGWIHIIPVNRTIKAGVADDAALVPLLRTWMRLNNIRWVTVTIMWGAAVWFIIAIGDFTSAV
ncbi:MAG: hypothetical protein ABW195_13285 [Ilumatobacteraceae bacterium]